MCGRGETDLDPMDVRVIERATDQPLQTIQIAVTVDKFDQEDTETSCARDLEAAAIIALMSERSVHVIHSPSIGGLANTTRNPMSWLNR